MSYPTLSIIIPCYNALSFVVKTLQSVAQQQTDGFTHETIIVDDGSQDGTITAIEQFLRSHPDFRGRLLKHQTNLGVAMARNNGIHAAQGDFVMFLDADDMLLPACCQSLLQLQRRYDADIVACNIMHLKSNGRTTPYCKAHGNIHFQGTALPQYPAGQPLFESSWCKLFRRSFLNDHHLLFTANLTFGEDTLFSHLAVLKARQVSIDFDTFGYLYRDNPTSCINTAKLHTRLDALSTILSHLADAIQDHVNPLLLRKACEVLWTIRKFSTDENRQEFLQQLLVSPLWHDLIYPNIMTYGKMKHRLCARLLAHDHLWAIKFW